MILQEKLESYLLKVPNYQEMAPSELIDYFIYFLTIIEGSDVVQSADIDACFSLSRLEKYSNIPAYLSRNSKKIRGKKPKLLKIKKGYQLERNKQLEIQKSLHDGPAKLETSHLLRSLLSKLPDKNEQLFLQEAIECYEIGAKRASIVLVWILTMHHMYNYINDNQLDTFNNVLSKNNDKRIKITKITKTDDFSEIPEGKFIEFMRSAKIISNDVRKILDAKLGIRNTYAHPSGVSVSEVKTNDFIIDLIENIVTKYDL
ncbi:MAG: hypothetical protein ACRBCI_15625 [Cellvibrionaceae bacterium]